MRIPARLTCADGVMFDFANCFDSPICGYSDRKPFQFIGLNQQKQRQRTQMGQRWRAHLSNLARWLLTRPKGRLSGGCVPCFNPSPSPLAALPLAPICTSLFLLHWEPPWSKSSRRGSYQDASKVNENGFALLRKHSSSNLMPKLGTFAKLFLVVSLGFLRKDLRGEA